MTPSRPTRMTRTITMRANCTSEHSSALLVVFPVSLMSSHDPLGSSRSRVYQLISTPCICAFLSDLFDLPFYFNLSFTVFFHSSVLMHPDLYTDLNNLDSVENNLQGSLDAYDVTHSLTHFVGSDTMPIRHRPDFKEALSTLRRLKNAEDQADYQNWWQSSSSSWWQWQDSWWHPASETPPRRWT